MNTLKHGDREITVLAERTVHAAPLCLRYRLECDDGLWISVESGLDRERVLLGSDLEAVWLLFCACVRGNVTPCTLEDVCMDFLYARANCSAL